MNSPLGQISDVIIFDVQFNFNFKVNPSKMICTSLLLLFIIRWNSMLSESCSISNGVKQGGVLYPILNGV